MTIKNLLVVLTDANTLRTEYIVRTDLADNLIHVSPDGFHAFELPAEHHLENWANAIDRVDNGYIVDIHEVVANHWDGGPDCAYRKIYAKTASTHAQWADLMRKAYNVPNLWVWVENAIYMFPMHRNPAMMPHGNWPVLTIDRTL